PRWRRAWRRGKQYAMAATVAFLALTTLALAASLLQRRGGKAGGGADDEPRVAHFSNLVKRRGVPEGVGPLSDEQVRRVGLAFRFHYRGQQVEAIDRRGRPNPRHSVSTYLAPAESGRLATATFASFAAARIQRLSQPP